MKHSEQAYQILADKYEKLEALNKELVVALKYALRFFPPSADSNIIHQALNKAEGK